MAQDKKGAEIPLIMKVEQRSLRETENQIARHVARLTERIKRDSDRRGMGTSYVSRLMFPSNKPPQAAFRDTSKKLGRSVNASFDDTFKKTTASVKQHSVQIKNHAKSWDSVYAGLMKAQKASDKYFLQQKRHMQNLATWQRNKIKASSPYGERNDRIGGFKKIGRGAVKTAAFAGGALLGSAVSIFKESIANFEKTMNSRLEGAATLGGKAQYAGGGSRWGYNAADAASIQASGAKQGITGGKHAGTTSMILQRGLGAEGVMFGGAMQSRQNLQGATGNKSMMRQLSAAMAVGVETGLDRARITEFLAAANQLSEQQIRITPGKSGHSDFTTELGRMQLGGLKGRFAGSALTQAHGAIQGASGAGQAFMMRAFGFGKGANLIDVLKRQEQGAGGGNLDAVMQQLQKEYGSGTNGGLSDAGKLAFKSMGMGSISMSEKFSQIYLDKKAGKLSPEEAKQKIASIKEEEKTKGMPKIQREAYEAMKRFGGPASHMAARFDKMIKLGGKNYKNLKFLEKIHSSMMKAVDPLFVGLRALMPNLAKAMKYLAGPMASGLKQIVKILTQMGGLIKAFFIGASKGNIATAIPRGLWAAGKAIPGIYGEGIDKTGTEIDLTGGLTKGTAAEYVKKLGVAGAKARFKEELDKGGSYKPGGGVWAIGEKAEFIRKMNQVIDNLGKPIVIDGALSFKQANGQQQDVALRNVRASGGRGGGGTGVSDGSQNPTGAMA